MGADGIVGHKDRPFVEEEVVEACLEDDKAVVDVVVGVGMDWHSDYHSFFETYHHLPSIP